MGQKRLLDKITITNTSASENNSNVNFITCVYDEDSEVIEVFAKSFADISSTDVGYSGDYFDQDYLDTKTTIRGNIRSEGYIDVFAKGDYLYTIEDSDDGPGGDPNGIRLIKTEISTGTEDEDNELTSGFSTSQSLGFYIDADNNLAYVIESGTFGARVFNITTGSHLSSNNIAAVGSDCWGCWLNESTDKFYMGDATDQMIYVWDVSTRSSPSRLALEDIDLSTANATIDFKHWSFSETNDRIYLWDTDASVVRSFKVSDQTHVSAEDITPSYPSDETGSFGTIFYADDSTFVLDGYSANTGITIFLYRISDGEFLGKTGTNLSANPSDSTNYKLSISDYKIYYELSDTTWNSQDFVSFPTTLVFPRSRDYISENVGTYWKRSPFNYTFRDADNLVFFLPFTSPPYFLKRSIAISELDVVDESLANDLKASVTAYTEPTGKTATDGSVTLSASGSNTPFTYQIIGKNTSNNSPQASATFSNLNGGTYQFRVVDANNVTYDLPPFHLNYTEDVFTNYGALYDFTWYDVTGDHYYKIEIVKKSYSGSTTTLSEAGANPFVYMLRGESSDIHEQTILASEATVELIGNQFDYIALAQGNDNDHGLVFYKHDGASTFEENWRGFILPRSYSEQIGSGGTTSTFFTAVDRLGDLKNYDYLMYVPSNKGNAFNPQFEAFYGGDKNAFQVLHYCLRQTELKMGYRIALDLFEDAHTKTSGNEPLNQIKIDTDSYFQNDSSWNMEQVVRALLEPFKAHIYSWEGYWYVVDKELLEGTSISYVEFDNTGTYVTTSSWSPRIDFKGPTESSRFRWVDGGIISTTEVYKDIQLKLDTQPRKEGIIPALNKKNANLGYGPYYVTHSINSFKGWVFSQGNTIIMNVKEEDGSSVRTDNIYALSGIYLSNDRPLLWEFNVTDSSTSDSKIIHTGKITHNSTDEIRINFDYNLSSVAVIPYGGTLDDATDRTVRAPYVPMKWTLQVGSYYYDSTSDEWSTTSATNQFFLNISDGQKVEKNIRFPDLAEQESTYRLQLFVPTLFEYDVTGSSKANMITALEGVATESLPNLTRIIARNAGATNSYHMYFYELIFDLDTGTSPDIIEPDDYNASTNNRRWQLVSIVSLGVPASIGTPNIGTRMQFKNIEAHFLPQGEEIPEEIILTRTCDRNNKLTYKKDLHHFDAPPEMNSPDKIFYNHFFTGTSTPSALWYKSGGIQRRIQDHYADWLVKKLKKTRFRVSSSVHVDIEFNPTNTLRDTFDDNKIYVWMGGSIDYKNNKVEGEFIELKGDTAVTSSAFTNAFDSNEIS